jgi:hypothetical protein
MTKVLCTGSRSWTDRRIIHEALHHLREGDVIVHGANGRYDSELRLWYGADVLVQQFALVHSIEQRPYPVTPAEWKKYGLAAGPRRNQHMYDAERPDEVYAFRMPGTSKGTDGMVKIALAGGTPVTLYYLDEVDGVVRATIFDWEAYGRIVGR